MVNATCGPWAEGWTIGFARRRSVWCLVLSLSLAGSLSSGASAEVVAKLVRDCELCPDLVLLPRGSFMIGSPATEPGREGWDKGSESPQRVVMIAQSFAIGALAVTRGQYADFVKATGHGVTADGGGNNSVSGGGCHTFDGTSWTFDSRVTWVSPDFDQTDDHPVVCVNHADAMAYVAWLNAIVPGGRYRLPSEAEREYAARAGTTSAYWWGPSITPDRANYVSSSAAAARTGTRLARSFAPNPWGLYQVHGNVWEWTADCFGVGYGDLPDSVATTGAARIDRGCDRRALRGGAWNRLPATLRAAYRTGLDPAFRGHSIGFRIVRDVPPQ